MTRLALATLALALATLATTAQEIKLPPIKKKKYLGTIERLDPAFDKLLAKDAKLEILADGFAWTEGPVWVPGKKGYLLFSDIPNNSVMKWQEGKGISLFLKPSGYDGPRKDIMEPGSNGLLRDPKGRLVLMQHGNRRVARLEKDKKFTTLADKYKGTRLNSPNDGVFKSNGDLYFTDPPYGLMLKGKFGEFPGQDLDFCGVYRLTPDKKLTLLTKEMTKPNGVALSIDEKTLYVGNSDPKLAYWKAFPINEDGTLGKSRIFFDATRWVGKKKGLPDGMKVDREGNLWATGPGGVLVFSPDGKHLGTIGTGVNTGNCCFGDDGSTLYVMCDKAIGRIRTLTKGKGFE